MPKGGSDDHMAAMLDAALTARAARVAARLVLQVKRCCACRNWLSFSDFSPAPS